MHIRTVIRFSSLAFIAVFGNACSGSGAAPAAKTEALPADGGELGKAFADLTSAMAAGDKARAGKLLDPNYWHMDNKNADFFVEISKQLKDYTSVGGKRQGDRATLFVATTQPYYAMVDATHTAGGWQFDSPLPTGTSFSAKGRDCATTGHRFPCAAFSAPDAQVSGRVSSHRKADPLTGVVQRVTLLDGVAVRMLDSESKTLKSTKLLLSGKGINPQMVALSFDPSEVRGWLNYPLLTLDIAPDGKSAKALYFDGFSRKDFSINDGLKIDTGAPGRMHGQLKNDIKDIAEIDIAFDISTASDCLDGEYQCGNE